MGKSVQERHKWVLFLPPIEKVPSNNNDLPFLGVLKNFDKQFQQINTGISAGLET